MACSIRLWFEAQVRIKTGSDVCHRYCPYTVLQTVQIPGVYGDDYDIVHYKEPLKSFEKSRL